MPSNSGPYTEEADNVCVEPYLLHTSNYPRLQIVGHIKKRQIMSVWSLTFFTHPTTYAFKQWTVERKKDGRRNE
jgi:hypothetical protein